MGWLAVHRHLLPAAACMYPCRPPGRPVMTRGTVRSASLPGDQPARAGSLSSGPGWLPAGLRLEPVPCPGSAGKPVQPAARHITRYRNHPILVSPARRGAAGQSARRPAPCGHCPRRERPGRLASMPAAGHLWRRGAEPGPVPAQRRAPVPVTAVGLSAPGCRGGGSRPEPPAASGRPHAGRAPGEPPALPPRRRHSIPGPHASSYPRSLWPTFGQWCRPGFRRRWPGPGHRAVPAR